MTDFLFYNHSILSLCLKEVGECDCPKCKSCDFSKIFTDENDNRILLEGTQEDGWFVSYGRTPLNVKEIDMKEIF